MVQFINEKGPKAGDKQASPRPGGKEAQKNKSRQINKEA
ncbi:uncharacterized protein G2W53_016852 [Senna tora]|uniref:Uncharacterized protein n=1 Tax=Senna tora TaxID=362788 RepID=A0A834TN99_9FABA|nr:uncharacterized protein G2W53_016852 [Senna tora]